MGRPGFRGGGYTARARIVITYEIPNALTLTRLKPITLTIPLIENLTITLTPPKI